MYAIELLDELGIRSICSDTLDFILSLCSFRIYDYLVYVSEGKSNPVNGMDRAEYPACI